MSVKEEIEALQSDDGMWHADRIVEWAQDNPKSALHSQFDWNDAHAANEFRLEQARRLIRIHVVTEAGEPKLVSLSYDRPRGGGYRSVEEVARSSDLSQILLRDALGDLRRVRERYKRMKQLTDVWAAIDKAQIEHQPELQENRVAV